MLETLAARHEFSLAAVKQLAKLYPIIRVESILTSLKMPTRRYFLRVNTLKATPTEVVKELRELGLDAQVYEMLPDAIFLPVKGPFPVKRLNKVVVAKKDAAESVYQGANLYASGVLDARKVKEGDKVSVVNPRGCVAAEGVAMMDGDDMVTRKRGLAVLVDTSVYKVPSVRELDIYKKGLIYDQSFPSIIAGHILSPKPDWLVIDMCAAPGGKATHAAQLMGGDGRVIAVDRSRGRVDKIKENAMRLGLSNVEARVADSRYLDVLEDDLVGADAVILDPPCSALGVRPNLYYEKEEREFQALTSYQRQFLGVAAKLLRRGGLLLYSTCTLTLEENEHNVLYAVEHYGFRPKRQTVFIGTTGFAGLTSHVQRFEPDIHDTPGFFIALLEKI
ncbi:MAG: methyltransferase domain-containing protein [Thermofilaceae archaeon]|nr:methyltransferase domain-containing protein [Thermofilaceae archaeon]